MIFFISVHFLGEILYLKENGKKCFEDIKKKILEKSKNHKKIFKKSQTFFN
jgi:hypothetical protein